MAHRRHTRTWYPPLVRGARFALALVVVLAGCSSEPIASTPGSGGESNAGTGGSGGASATGGTAGVTTGGVGGAQAGMPATGGASSAGTSGASGAGQAGLAGTGGGAGAPTAGSAGAAGSTAGSGGSAGAAGGPGFDAIEALRAHLAIARDMRPVLVDEPFASVPLTKDQADTAKELLWDEHDALIRETRQAESDQKAITLDGRTLRYDFTTFGTEPATGHSLFISLHGGGEADPSVNDDQWENQKTLYQPEEGMYLAPRAPTNTWNLWHEAHIDPMFARLIENLIVLEGVDSNHVYVMGYSAGGDGVYQLGPRMADSWAAAAMMAGHPNDAKPDSLRNIGFTIHVGGLDTAYDRNLIAAEWGTLLDDLAVADPGGYEHYVEVHEDKPHWMDLEDAVAVPWMAEFTRDPVPKKIVWLQDDVPHERFYWLAVPPEEAQTATRVVAEADGQAIALEVDGIQTLKVRLSDALVDLDQPVTITAGAASLFSGPVSRTIGVIATTLEERGDPALVFSGEVEVTLD